MDDSLQKAPRATILVVDDDKGTVEFIRTMLEGRGYKMVSAYSGQEAMDLLDQTAEQATGWKVPGLDLLLLDIMMPGVDGFKVCQRVKDDPRLCHIPVIMVTALEKAADKIAAVEFGADDYITKPFQPEELAAAITAKLQVKAREEGLLRRAHDFSTLNAVAFAASYSLDLRQVLANATERLMEHMGVDAVAVFLLDDRSQDLTLAHQRGFASGMPANRRHTQVGVGVVGQVALAQKAVLRLGIGSDPEFDGVEGKERSLGACAVVPLRSADRTVGVLEVYHHDPYYFDELSLELLEQIGAQVGVAVENAQLFQHTQILLIKSSALSQTAGEEES
jgi:DNA-binding response OmpR family regulator